MNYESCRFFYFNIKSTEHAQIVNGVRLFIYFSPMKEVTILKPHLIKYTV